MSFFNQSSCAKCFTDGGLAGKSCFLPGCFHNERRNVAVSINRSVGTNEATKVFLASFNILSVLDHSCCQAAFYEGSLNPQQNAGLDNSSYVSVYLFIILVSIISNTKSVFLITIRPPLRTIFSVQDVYCAECYFVLKDLKP